MRSRFTCSNPASRAHCTARSTPAGSWVRPSSASTWGCIDCTPNDSRFTPALRYERELLGIDRVGVALDGHLGALARARSPPRMRARPSAGISDGVPATEEDARRSAARRRPSARRGPRRRRRRSRRSGGRGPSRWRSRSSRSAPHRTGCARTRRAVTAADSPTTRRRTSMALTFELPPEAEAYRGEIRVVHRRARTGREVPGRLDPAARRRRVRRSALAPAVGARRVADRAARDRRGAEARVRTRSR